MANAGYDYRNPPSLGELNLEVTGENMHGLNETQRMLRKKGHRISLPREPVRITLKEKNEKKTTHYITAEETSDEQSKQPLPRRLVLECVEPLGARGLVFDRISISTQENDGLSSRSSVFRRIQRDCLPSQEHSSVFDHLSSPKLQDDQLDSGFRPSVFHQLRKSKDYESKPEGSSQKSIFERKQMAKGLKSKKTSR
ncbi:hypothetical protein ACH5RR_028878 [Cinchona calisaya]|uniref:Uncharacterized protein n=1 Tax=Cinchona calisaya TaxID=153742 RepID=A0ABD2YUI8_9GENT